MQTANILSRLMLKRSRSPVGWFPHVPPNNLIPQHRFERIGQSEALRERVGQHETAKPCEAQPVRSGEEAVVVGFRRGVWD
jgi:hypothetical protein